jgi:hypothetical protein
MHAFSLVRVIAARMFHPGVWGLFWWLAPILVLVAAPSRRRPPTLLLAVAAAIPVVVAWAAYSQVPAAGYYAEVTWNRILLQAAVPIFGLLALSVRKLLGMAS